MRALAGSRDDGPRVSVVARLRPVLAEEATQPLAVTVHAPHLRAAAGADGLDDGNPPGTAAQGPQGAPHKAFVSVAAPFHPQKTFAFHDVLSSSADDDVVFKAAAAPAIPRIFQGRAHAIIQYGQSNSGKTHTWRALLRRSAVEIFDMVARLEAERGEHCSVAISALQLYNDVLTDLLVPGSSSPTTPTTTTTANEWGRAGGGGEAEAARLYIRDDPATGGFTVRGLSHAHVTTVDELLSVVDEAGSNRAVAATGMNASSSRSHVLVTIRVTRRVRMADGALLPHPVEGRLCLADLAGCERLSRTNATGARKAEAQSINASLTALGNVVHALAEQGERAQKQQPGGGCGAAAAVRHVPYRDSRLTKLLHEYLAPPGGRATLILTISPTRQDAAETSSVLQFGQRAMHIAHTSHYSDPTATATGHGPGIRKGAPSPAGRSLVRSSRMGGAGGGSAGGGGAGGAGTQSPADGACESLMSALEAAQELVSTLEARVTQLEVQLGRSNDRNEDLDAEAAELREAVAARDGKLQKVEAASSEAQRALERVRDELDDMSTQLSAYKRDNEYLSHQATTLRSEKTDLQRQCEDFRRAFDEERAAKSELLHALRVEEHIPLSFLTVESIATFVRKEIHSANSNAAQMEQRLRELRDKLDTAAAASESEIRALRDTVAARDAKIARLETRCAAAEDDRRSASAADASAVEEMREERDRLRRELRDLTRKYAALEEKQQQQQQQQHRRCSAEDSASSANGGSGTATTLGVGCDEAPHTSTTSRSSSAASNATTSGRRSDEASREGGDRDAARPAASCSAPFLWSAAAAGTLSALKHSIDGGATARSSSSISSSSSSSSSALLLPATSDLHGAPSLASHGSAITPSASLAAAVAPPSIMRSSDGEAAALGLLSSIRGPPGRRSSTNSTSGGGHPLATRERNVSFSGVAAASSGKGMHAPLILEQLE